MLFFAFVFFLKKRVVFLKKKTWPKKAVFFFANFVASGNTHWAFLFPGF